MQTGEFLEFETELDVVRVGLVQFLDGLEGAIVDVDVVLSGDDQFDRLVLVLLAFGDGDGRLQLSVRSARHSKVRALALESVDGLTRADVGLTARELSSHHRARRAHGDQHDSEEKR